MRKLSSISHSGTRAIGGHTVFNSAISTSGSQLLPGQEELITTFKYLRLEVTHVTSSHNYSPQTPVLPQWQRKQKSLHEEGTEEEEN